MQFSMCKLRTHQWCFLLFNVVLFHALLFGADLVEEYLLQPAPGVYTNRSVLDIRERARKLDLSGAARDAVSRSYPIANPDACPDPDLFLLALVFSAPGNASQRDAVRATWANRSSVRGFPVRTLFFLGSPRPAAAQEAVLREAERHGDLVQSHATASARSRTERTVLALRWAVAFCPAARFLLLADEGVFVNLPALGGYLLGLQRHPEDLYLGRMVHKDAPDRDPSSPGYLPPALYPDRYLPDYCSSAAFVLSQDVARKVYVASAAVRAAPMPADAYVGLCARMAAVVPVHSWRFSGNRHVRYNACCYRWLFSSAGVEGEELREVWREVGRDDGGCSLLETYVGLLVCKVLTYMDKVSFFSSQGGAVSNSSG